VIGFVPPVEARPVPESGAVGLPPEPAAPTAFVLEGVALAGDGAPLVPLAEGEDVEPVPLVPLAEGEAVEPAPLVLLAEGVALAADWAPLVVPVEGVALEPVPLVLLAEGEGVEPAPLPAVVVPPAAPLPKVLEPLPPAAVALATGLLVAPLAGVPVAEVLPASRFAQAMGRVSCFGLPSSLATVSGSFMVSATPWISTT